MIAHALAVTLDDRLLTLSRALALLRRRTVGVQSIVVSPAGPGLFRLVVLLSVDAPTAERLALVLRKVVGVREVLSWQADPDAARGLALVRMRRGEPEAELLDTLRLFRATVVAEDADTLTVELAGPAPFLLAAVRALEPWGVLDVARTGTLPIAPPTSAPSIQAAS